MQQILCVFQSESIGWMEELTFAYIFSTLLSVFECDYVLILSFQHNTLFRTLSHFGSLSFFLCVMSVSIAVFVASIFSFLAIFTRSYKKCIQIATANINRCPFHLTCCALELVCIGVRISKRIVKMRWVKRRKRNSNEWTKRRKCMN